MKERRKDRHRDMDGRTAGRRGVGMEDREVQVNSLRAQERSPLWVPFSPVALRPSRNVEALVPRQATPPGGRQ